MAVYRVEIPMRLPSLNTYINECRRNRYAGAKFKANLESEIAVFLSGLPRIEKPIKITFLWVEENRRRDLDNLCYSKKFILDAMVKSGVISNDNRKHVAAFTDTFEYAKESKVVLTIEELEDGRWLDG